MHAAWPGLAATCRVLAGRLNGRDRKPSCDTQIPKHYATDADAMATCASKVQRATGGRGQRPAVLRDCGDCADCRCAHTHTHTPRSRARACRVPEGLRAAAGARERTRSCTARAGRPGLGPITNMLSNKYYYPRSDDRQGRAPTPCHLQSPSRGVRGAARSPATPHMLCRRARATDGLHCASTTPQALACTNGTRARRPPCSASRALRARPHPAPPPPPPSPPSPLRIISAA